MSNPRFNGFNLIHKALRLMLYETGNQVQQNDFTNKNTTEGVLKQVEFVLGIYEEHAKHENNVILPAVEKHNSELAKQFESEHQEDFIKGDRVLGAIQDWGEAGTDQQRWELGRELLYSFNDFTAFNLEHMNREETILNEELWKNYTDEEILAMAQQISRAIEPQRAAVYNQWVFAAINAPEAIFMLQNAQHNAPEAVYNGLLKIAKENLDPERWGLVEAALVIKPAAPKVNIRLG